MKKNNQKKITEDVNLEKEVKTEEPVQKPNPFAAWDDLVFPRKPEPTSEGEVTETPSSEEEKPKKQGWSWI